MTRALASSGSVNVVGGGPTGALLAILMRRRGFDVTLYDARPDPRGRVGESGRSINLALAERGIHALKTAGVYSEVAVHLVPMRGRMIHALDATTTLHRYGHEPDEQIYSISRQLLNQTLLRNAIAEHGAVARFAHRLDHIEWVDPSSGASSGATLEFTDLQTGGRLQVPMTPTLAADGAGSMMRRTLTRVSRIASAEVPLQHGYKELSIAASPDGGYRMEREALHIWPRGSFMLIALPNTDGSFTATLFLALSGPVSFEALRSPEAIHAFFATQFPDALELMPGCVAEFQANPTGSMGTVFANPWHLGGDCLLVGDSAHAIVPFHGQGMNCCFEDCLHLDACLDRHDSWTAAFSAFYSERKPDTDAIAAMALENYQEMRERIADPKFQLQQALALELERRHPERFIPRYSMVMFHHEIPYRLAMERGAVQAQLLTELTQGAENMSDIDFARAGTEIAARLAPLMRVGRGPTGPDGLNGGQVNVK